MSFYTQIPAIRDAYSTITTAHPVPSGQEIELFEVLIDEVSTDVWIRFRFIAPNIGKEVGSLTFAQVQDDFEHLCKTVALPYIQRFDLAADTVVIALSDKPVEFGQSDGSATQYIEAFRVNGGACAWEDF